MGLPSHRVHITAATLLSESTQLFGHCLLPLSYKCHPEQPPGPSKMDRQLCTRPPCVVVSQRPHLQSIRTANTSNPVRESGARSQFLGANLQLSRKHWKTWRLSKPSVHYIEESPNTCSRMAEGMFSLWIFFWAHAVHARGSDGHQNVLSLISYSHIMEKGWKRGWSGATIHTDFPIFLPPTDFRCSGPSI